MTGIGGVVDATTEVWARPEGDLRADLSVGAVRMRRDGSSVPVDLTLRATKGGAEPVAPAFFSIDGRSCTNKHRTTSA